ncbi:hypothetical protein GCM10010921_26980 [Microbacterium album]|uniref:Glycosyltransferase 2-like domain-containing protein n=2 Tax=Microbacterium album TaxID=2053191 RepID=A0A917IHI9_9MICO|nr:hypothetical protein GCM10010921_26980 [Microbacterium album]
MTGAPIDGTTGLGAPIGLSAPTGMSAPTADVSRPRESPPRPARSRRLPAARLRPEPSRARATVSVVVPCFNYARFLEQAVGSALRQRGVDVEVIVVDDASTDASLQVARRLAHADPRVRVLANARNLGPVHTFNRGLRAATGEFLVRLDADDLLTPGALERAAAVFQHLPSVGMVYGRPLHFAHARGPARLRARSWTVWDGRAWLEARCAAGDNVITSPEVVVRRSILAAIGGQRDLAHTHDMELWLRIAAHADVAYVAGCDQAWHREHPDSLSTRAQEPRVFLREVRAGFDMLCDALGEGERLRRRARRAVALAALRHGRRDIDRARLTREAEELLAFAVETFPWVLATPEGRRFEAARRRAHGWPRLLAIAAGAAPRLLRRLQVRVRLARWHRTGVYEPLRAARSLARGAQPLPPREAA